MRKDKRLNFGPIRKETPVLWDWGSHELSILITLVGSKPKKIDLKRMMQEINEEGDVSAWKLSANLRKD